MSLVLEGVRRAFGETVALDGINLAAAPGEVLCLLGPSGCGKTTALRVAAGLEAADSGIVRIGGGVVDEPPGTFVAPELRRVGLVFQDYALFPHLTVLENVAFGVREKAGREARARDLLVRMNLAGSADIYPHTLSGGEQQRVALARALAPRPVVMLLDEPFSGLDFRLRDRVGEESLALLRDLGTATVMVTHDSDEAMRLADRVALMRAGRVVQDGTPADLYRHPASPFVAEFFSEINRFEGVVESGSVVTPLGPVPAAGLADGARAVVVVRPEAVRVLPGQANGAAVAHVVRVQDMGTYLLLTLQQPGGGPTYLSRVPDAAGAREGAEMAFGLETAGCFVFAGEGG